MLKQVKLEAKRLEDYRSIVGDEVIEEIRALAAPLKGARLVHVSATAYGGVAELLQVLVPPMRDVGIDAQWQAIEGASDYLRLLNTLRQG